MVIFQPGNLTCSWEGCSVRVCWGVLINQRDNDIRGRRSWLVWFLCAIKGSHTVQICPFIVCFPLHQGHIRNVAFNSITSAISCTLHDPLMGPCLHLRAVQWSYKSMQLNFSQHSKTPEWVMGKIRIFIILTITHKSFKLIATDILMSCAVCALIKPQSTCKIYIINVGSAALNQRTQDVVLCCFKVSSVAVFGIRPATFCWPAV